jgi:hypothetical protein
MGSLKQMGRQLEEYMTAPMTWAGGAPSRSEDQFGWELMELLDVLRNQFGLARQLRAEVAQLGFAREPGQAKELTQKMDQLKLVTQAIGKLLDEAKKIYTKWERA